MNPPNTCHVCGGPTSAKTAHARATLHGETYLLCCRMCETALEAGALQRRLMPASRTGPTAHLTVRYLPALHVGGDFAWLDDRDSGEIVLAVGDVSGHGVTSALASSRLVPEVERRLRETDDLASIAIDLNRVVLDLFGGERTYSTLFLAVADPQHGRLRYLSCGHPPTLLWRANDAQPRPLPGAHFPIGLMEPAVFATPAAGEVRLARGDQMLAYTDGLLELLPPGSEGTETERLARLFAALVGRGSVDREPRAFARVAARHRAVANDDVLYVLARFRGGSDGVREARQGTQGEARDPVCGMVVSIDTPYRLIVGDDTSLFCSATCLERGRAGRAR